MAKNYEKYLEVRRRRSSGSSRKEKLYDGWQ